jgi:hypothetical protein
VGMGYRTLAEPFTMGTGCGMDTKSKLEAIV